ncbi:unnamed protein product [Adineta steineri]|uniref:NHL repeat containing protein n=1 Tax=Adineta steineri TaxID=433720 RepID=A0A814BZB9_9BILA|nr:unnamed protein product [Adineta steineri]CAF0936142.1 unnamed protein product [Adineta steineri]CAF0971521.1 unnamed protein product [Adineta steineri]
MTTSNRIAAGTSVKGSALHELNHPAGIFVDVNLDLYVADCGNDRVQLFYLGKSNGITVAGSKSLNPTITLRYPTGIILDAEKYLFIVDSDNHRIIGSSLNGFRCLVGCYGRGSQSNQLNGPFTLSFDHSGNIYVTDPYNGRIQIFLLMKDSFALSFNQPKFCTTSIWNYNGITFANRSIVGEYPRAIFVNTNNTIYVANQEDNTIVMWNEEHVNPAKIIHGNFTQPYSLFVTSNGDIYIDDGFENGQVQKWIAETNNFVTVMNVNSSCHGLFVDINDTLYCSMPDYHQVVKRSLNDALMNSNRVAAGTGINGSALNELNYPSGIFVDVNLDLYVADSMNNRVQLFQPGQSNGITVAGSRSQRQTTELNYPTGIILDAEKYLYIVDQMNHRIVGSDLNGFRCLVGCNGEGSQSNRLNYPFSLSFGRFGNIYVTDQNNHRIQKFEYFEESCMNTTSIAQTVYTSELTTNSSTYLPKCLKLNSYYEAIQVNVRRSGRYTFLSTSNMDTYGFIYKDYFNPFNPVEKQLAWDDDGCDLHQFIFTTALEASITYILVVTAYDTKVTGEFSILISGPGNVDLKNILNTSSVVRTLYTSKLTTNSSTYLPECSFSSSYYEAIQVTVRRSGFYTFLSSSNMDTYGSIYKEYFNPSNPKENLPKYDDQGCDLDQFMFTVALETSNTYILAVSVSDHKVTGEFSIFVSGPDNVDLSNISKYMDYNY